MGLLGGKKKIYVASSVYNMAGDQAERINFAKTIISGSILGNRNFSMTDALTNNYLAGPGIKMRNFHRWCRKHYGHIGVPKMKIMYSDSLDLVTIGTYVPRDAGQLVEATYVRIGSADFAYWAEQWVMENHPDDFGLEWFAEYNSTTNIITINWPDLSTDTFTPVNFDQAADYIYVVYALKTASSFLGSKLWIYKIGDGIGYLDSLMTAEPEDGEVLPFIPIRIDSRFLSGTYKSTEFELAKKAYTKATGNRGKRGLPDLISKIKENDDIDDVDHAYVVFGVSLNAVDNSARKYLYKFFDMMRKAQPYNTDTYAQWTTDQADYEDEIGAFDTSREALGGAAGGPTDPATTGTVPALPAAPVTEVVIKNPGPSDTKLHMRMSWRYIAKGTGSGLAKPDAKVGELFWANRRVGATIGSVVMVNGSVPLSTDQSTVRLVWQKTADSWEMLVITGLIHENLIYKDKEVTITAIEAHNDDEESGFLVPLHYATLKKMSLVDSTQMMTAASYLVFNSYEVVKQKWYETFIFKVILFIVVIAITVITMGAAAPGLLGPALAVGTAVGLTGLAAVIAGAVINALAAMILMHIISAISTAAFGPKVGAIIAAVVSIVAMNVGSAMMSGQSLTTMWGNMMNAQNIMAMTSAVGNGVAGYMKASAMETMGQTQDMLKEYEAEYKRIHDLFVKEFGMGDFHFDPKNLTDVNAGGISESPQMFLDRTLMTGSDIAEMSIDMLHGFADATLSVDAIGK